ncbi:MULTISPECIES: hypothetical protein [Moorena]|uniref:hypothetical protein n=1 Tax=Moorena TaxID=1155738 RepID=UPI0012B669DE|nr:MULTISPECIES: hypothetical protein [Moorena]
MTTRKGQAIIHAYSSRQRCSAVLGRQRGLGEAARSWGGSAVLGVPPMSDCRGPPMSDCRGPPHERLPWFPP